MMAHAALGKAFPDLPVILTTSSELGLSASVSRRVSTTNLCPGPNGPLPQEITDMYPNAPFIKREGEVDAWDNAEFRAAIKATNRTQIIIAGIVTDVCTYHFAFLPFATRD
jgi:nicotinamidase-related amidase